ncbi:MAG: DUF1048 domain-containing protein [Clostridiaceae bacterium]
MITLKEQIKRNYELSKKLSKEYDDVYGELVIYLRTSKLSDVDAEDAISDILAMLIDGEERNATIEEILGDDLKGFCDNIISSYESAPKKFNLRENLQYIIIIICIGTFWSYVNIEVPKIIKGAQSYLTFNYSVAMLLNTVIMGISTIITVKYLITGNLEIDKKKRRKKSIIEYFKIYGLFLATVAILVASQLYLGKFILFTTKVYFVVIFITALFLIKRFIEPKIE